MTRPDVGHGAKKLKSNILGCGEIDINLKISGLLINSCIEIKAPKEKPITQLSFEFELFL